MNVLTHYEIGVRNTLKLIEFAEREEWGVNDLNLMIIPLLRHLKDSPTLDVMSQRLNEHLDTVKNDEAFLTLLSYL